MTFLLRCLVANYRAILFKLCGRREMRYMSWREVLRWTELTRRIYNDVWVQGRWKRKLHVLGVDGAFLTAAVDGLSFHYPAGADLDVLGRTCYEVLCPGCGHFYDTKETRPRLGDVLYDIGACEGLYSLKHSGVAAKAYLFEPSRRMCQALEKTFQCCPGKAIILNLLLADQEAPAVAFFDDPKDPTQSRFAREGENGTYSLQVRTIDIMVREGGLAPPSVIKMDVQGSELQILKGAAETIRRYRPRMAITSYHNAGDASDLVEYCMGIRPDYRYRLKGVTTMDPVPRPTMVHFF